MRVLKVGGNELADAAFVQGLAESVAKIKADSAESVVIVHGGGKAIADLQARVGLKTVKVDGLRVTDPASLEVAEMVLSGHSNKLLVKGLLAAGVDAIGVSGVDGGLLRAQKKPHPTADLGLVGTVADVRTELLTQWAAAGLTVVVSPISLGLEDGLTYNVNADEAAAAVASAVGASQLDFISNVPGVLRDGDPIATLTAADTAEFIEAGVITGGMIPKVQSALAVVQRGVARVRIVNLAGLASGGGTVFQAA